MVELRFTIAAVSIGVALSVPAGAAPIPSAMRIASLAPACTFASEVSAAVADPSATAGDYSPVFDRVLEFNSPDGPQAQSGSGTTGQNSSTHPAPAPNVPVDANGNPIPLERQEPTANSGLHAKFPDSSQAEPSPLLRVGSTTSSSPRARPRTILPSFFLDSLRSARKVSTNTRPWARASSGFWSYTWRGFLDKTDGTYLSAWLLPALIHEDTRFYALGAGHNYFVRELYVISRQGVARTYGGHQTPNIAGLGGKVLTQVVSRNYYPKSATTFPVLAEKFGYSAMRDVIFTSIREFYPDAAAHFIRRHREKMAAKAAARDATTH